VPTALIAHPFLPPFTTSAQRSVDAADAMPETLRSAVAKTDVAIADAKAFFELLINFSFFMVCMPSINECFECYTSKELSIY
jgi:hypothetical protein